MAGMNTISSAAYEGDIVSRLRNWRGLHLAHSGDLFEEAAAEIERLRSQPGPYVTGTVTHHCTLTPFTLTDEEREAIVVAARWCEEPIHPIHSKTSLHALCAADTLRALLGRTK